ncbi:MAG: hypothetical protein IT378_13630 [Sandaracinaceae bacterium]|nr:hypothetical protein [Sandaracinaceae bacterium]MCC6875341.1 hypothetical protein [Sandaracinaceae bacterium]
MRSLLEGDEVREVLRDAFYSAEIKPPVRARRKPQPKPEHYEVICISLYKEDLERLDAKVQALKTRGHRKMSRSALIRYALDHVDLDSLPRSY